MCLILFSYRRHPRYRLIVASNRDEYYERPTRPAAFWQDAPDLLAGRDLRNRGTWMGITRRGRFAVLTNYRDPASQKQRAPSRGLLVRDFLTGDLPPDVYCDQIRQEADRYNGFNLLADDAQDLYYYSNRGNGVQRLPPGLYGLSNHLLDTPWPKVRSGKAALQDLTAGKAEIRPEALFEMLADDSRPPDNALPDTGVGLAKERMLAPLFITSPDYGTRSSTVLLVDKSGCVEFFERTYEIESGRVVAHSTRPYRFHSNSR